MDFAELLFTMRSSLKGVGTGTVREVVFSCLPPVLLAAALFTVFTILILRTPDAYRAVRKVGRILCPALFALSLVAAAFAFRFPAYLIERLSAPDESVDFYKDYYVDPETVGITAPEKPKNLIYIYLESMETTYADSVSGGSQTVNYIPRLTALANDPENISFSDSDALGGFRSMNGAGWTMGALMGSTSGVPFSVSVFGEETENSTGGDGSFANGLVTLGDILAGQGYTQEFLCGSEAAFAGRDTYFTVHGNYKILDLKAAQAEGRLPTPDYTDDWWGFEDFRLYEIAKEELLRLAGGDTPFNLTLLTVDTHHVSGHLCERCGNAYPEQLMNILDCADRQIAEFLDWCREQDFYKDTVIVITGDHPRMDTDLVSDTDVSERTIYNCFINSAIAAQNTSNRVASTADIFPTTLAAMGYVIPGERLGLGTNLFSDRQTIAEELGFDLFDEAVGWYSEYYITHFLKINNTDE